jgi:hypothetical protein
MGIGIVLFIVAVIVLASWQYRADLEALLPDRWLAAHPEHRLEQREEESGEAQVPRRRKRAARHAAVA